MSLVLAAGCRREDPDELLHAARANLAAGRLEEAEDRLARLARVRPLTVEERVLRAQVAYDRGRLDEALAALDDPRGREPKQGPDAALLSAWRGWVEMERHRFRGAEAHLKRALALEPDRAQARRQLIELYAIQRRPADVAAEARTLARSGTLDFPYLYAWTLGEREGIDLAEQAAMLGDAVRADPEDRASRLALAETLRRLGRLDEAANALSALPATEPRARAIAARTALDRGRAADAEAILAETDGTSLDELRGRLALLREDAAVGPALRGRAAGRPGQPRRALRPRPGAPADRRAEAGAPPLQDRARPRPPRMACPRRPAPGSSQQPGRASGDRRDLPGRRPSRPRPRLVSSRARPRP